MHACTKYHEIPICIIIIHTNNYTCTQYPTLQQWVPWHYWWCKLHQLHYPHDTQSVRTENRTYLSSMCAVAWVPKCIPPHTMVNNIPVRLRNFVVLLLSTKVASQQIYTDCEIYLIIIQVNSDPIYTDLLQYLHMHCTYLITPTLRVPFSDGISRIQDGPKMMR